ncbi:hypothetical protein [Nocardia tenerifensis]|nr:hypothetical protein [Nocardia tenerifensis]
MPSLLAELDITLSRGDVISSAGSLGYVRATRVEQALPYNTGAAKAHRDVRAVLTDYATRVSAAVAQRVPGTAVDQARFLVRYLPQFPDDSDVVAGLEDALTEVVRSAYRVIDRPETLASVGNCECGLGLYARQDIDIVRCEGCGAVISVRHRRRQMLNQVYEVMGTAAELARLMPDGLGGRISAERIRQWARRGRLPSHIVDNRTVYRLGDVIELCAPRRSNRRRSA